MSTNKQETLQDINKTKLNTPSTTSTSTNDLKKQTVNKTRPRSNSAVNRPNNGKMATTVKKTIVVSTNPPKGRPRSSSLGQNKSKSKIPNSLSTITPTNKTNANSLNKSSSTTTKSNTKSKAASTLTTGSKTKPTTSSSSALKPKTSSTLKPKTSSSLRTTSSSSSTTLRPKTSSTLKSTISSSSTLKSTTTSSSSISKSKTPSTLKSKTSSTLKTTTSSSTTLKPKISTTLKSKTSSTVKAMATSSTVKPKTSTTLKSKTPSSTSALKSKTSATLKSKTSTTLKPKTSATLKPKTSTTLKPKISTSTIKSKGTSSLASPTSPNRIKSTSTTIPKKVNTVTSSKIKSTSTVTPSKVKSTSTVTSSKVKSTINALNNSAKPKTTLRSTRLSTTNSRLKPSTASSTTPSSIKSNSVSSSLKVLSKPKSTLSNVSTISSTSSTTRSRSNSTITSRLTSSPTPYSSQNSSTSSSTTSTHMVRRKKPNPYANVKAKVNSLPSSRASSTSSTSTVRAKNSVSSISNHIANTKSSIVKKTPSTKTITKNNTPQVIVTSSSIDNKSIDDKINENTRKEDELATALSKSLQKLVKTESIGINNITPIETPVSSSPIVAPLLITKDTSKPENSGSIPPSPAATPKLDAGIERSNSTSTNNEILDEYIKNIKYDPDALKQLDPNELSFSDSEENHDKSPPLSFIADTKHYDDISVSTDDFLDCESNFSDAKSSQKSPKMNTTDINNNNNNLSKVSSISNLSTISSISSITHKSSNNSLTSSVSISTLKSIFDNTATPRISSPIPSSTPKIKKLSPQTLQLFENQSTPTNSRPGSPSPLKNSTVSSRLQKTGISKTPTPSSKLNSPKLKTTVNSYSSPRLKDTSSPLMKAVKSRVDSNFGSISKSTINRVSSSSSVSSLNRPSLSKVSSTSSLSSLNKPSLNKPSIVRSKTPLGTRTSSTTSLSSMGRASSQGSIRTKTPTLSGSLTSRKTSTPSSVSKVSSITRTKTPTLSSSLSTPKISVTKTSSVSSTTSNGTKTSTLKNTTKSPSNAASKPLTVNTSVKKAGPVHLSPNIPRRNTRVTSLQPNKSSEVKKVEEVYDDDDEFKDTRDDTFIIKQEFSAEPESVEEILVSDNKALLNEYMDKKDDKAIPSYTVKRHTLDQSQICEISEDSFILNQYVEENHYYQTKHSHHEELIGDLLKAEEIINQVKEEEKRKEEKEAIKNESENNVENDTIENDNITKLEPPLTESNRINETEYVVNEDEDGMSIGSINVKKLLKKNIGNIIKPKNLSNLIKKKSSLEMNESFESNNSLSDNASEVSGNSDKRDSKGSTSYVFSMFMQSLNGANNLIKKKRNSGNFEDMKITISGPYQDDDSKSPTRIDDNKSDISSVAGSFATDSLAPKMVVVPLNTSIEIPKRVSSALPGSDDESVDSTLVNASTFKSLNNPMKIDMSSSIPSTPFKLINKSVEKNKEKHTSADSAICLGDSITYDNIKEIINEEWTKTINQQKFAVNHIIEESDSESMITLVSPSTSICSSRTIQNNQILKHLSLSQESIASHPEESEEITETMALIQKHLKKINNIICEIASTEKTYVHELSKLLEIYYYPMEQNQVLNQTEMNYLYSNIVSIYQFHSEIFYPKLDLVQREHEKNIKLINDAEALKSASSIKLINESISIEAFFKIVLWPFQFLYKPYYVNFKKASDFVSILNSTQKHKYSSDDVLIQAEELQFNVNCPIFERENKKKLKKLKAFLKSCTERMDHNQVDILGYLILPIQRLPRYLLLLEGLAKSAKLLEEATAKLPKPVVPEPILEKVKTTETVSKIAKPKANGDMEKPTTPKINTSKLSTPKINASKPSTPKTPKTPKSSTPKLGASKPSTPKPSTPKLNTSKPSTPKLSTSKLNASKPSTPKLNTSKPATSTSLPRARNNSSNKNINKLKETLNQSSNATVNNIEAKKATERTDRANKTKINVKSIVAQLENSQPTTTTKTGTPRTRTGVKPKTNVTARVNSNLPKTTTKSSNTTINRNKTTTGPNRTRTPSTVNRNNTKVTKPKSTITTTAKKPTENKTTTANTENKPDNTSDVTPENNNELDNAITESKEEPKITEASTATSEEPKKETEEISTKKEKYSSKTLSINTLVNEISTTSTANTANTTNTSTLQKSYTIAMAAEDIKNIIELCNKAITV